MSENTTNTPEPTTPTAAVAVDASTAAPTPIAVPASTDATTTTNTTTTTAAEAGVCPVKTEYRRSVPARVVLDAEGKTRGMNRPEDRAKSEFVAGTLKPTLEGESNFFHGEVLQRIKDSYRSGKQNNNNNNRNHNNRQQPQEGNKRPREAEGDAVAEEMKTEENIAPVETTKDVEEDVAARLEPSQSEDSLRERHAAQKAAAKKIFTNQLVLAPLTTVGNIPFRRVCKGLGADVTVSEMALVYNLNRLQKNEWSLLRRHESEDIFGIQVAVSGGRDASAFARALERSEFKYDFIDINCGCPVDKIVQSGCGCGLWERKGRLQEVVQGLSSLQSAPVSVKCRMGPDMERPSLHKVIGEYEGWGAAAVTVHGRSRKQRYTKNANWEYTEECARLTDLPVIGNGDIFAWEDVALHREKHPHVSSFMIGRGALIKPWIFEEIESGQARDISSSERLDILKDFCKFGLAHWGADERGVMSTRRYLCEWLSFLHRYVPVGLLERLPQRMNDRPPFYAGRDDLETLMSSDSVTDWISISEMLLGPVEAKFHFTPKHKSNAYSNVENEG